MDNVALHLQTVITALRASEAHHHREKNSVTLLAVSKKQAVEKIQAAYAAGQRRFGENYLQKALEKMPQLPPDIEWHFIGPLQSNKLKKIAEHFTWVQSVATLSHAKKLSASRPAHLRPLNICLQVNISHEATKGGLDAADVLPLASACQALPGLKLRGLMFIPAPTENTTAQRAIFKKCADLQTSLLKNGINLDTLSMGMSDDMDAAIAEGATLVRIGTNIFGQR